MNLTNLGEKILTDIAIVFPVTLDQVKLIYKNIMSIDATIAILKTSRDTGVSPFEIMIELLKKKGQL